MRIFVVALFLFAHLYAVGSKTVVFSEDFSWLAYGSEKGWIATDEKRIDKWSAAQTSMGWTSRTTWCYARQGFIKLGKTSYGGDACSPILEKIGAKPVNATITFQAIGWGGTESAATEGRKLYVGVIGGGKVVSVSGGADNDVINANFKNTAYGLTGAADITLADDNHFDNLEETATEIWRQGNTWYTIEVQGATDKTRIVFLGGNYNSTPTNRVFLDNIQVEVENEIDSTNVSMMIRKKNGNSLAIRNSEIDSVSFDYTDNIPETMFAPDTVFTVGRDFPLGLESYKYLGKGIDLEEKRSFTFDVTANNGYSHQSSAAYGEYLFMVTDKLASIYMYNLKRKEMVCTCMLTPHQETVSSSSSTVLYHCNQSTFGTIKYDPNDPFPLLYVSQRALSADKRCFINVFRIIPKMNSEGTEYASFTIEEVQKILLPPATTENALGNANFTIDPQTGNFYTYSRNNNSKDSNYQNCRITRFPAVDLSKSEVIYEDSDILESYEIFYPHNNIVVSALNMQGAFIWNKKLYISQGYPSCGFVNIHVVDLEAKKEVSYVDLLAAGFPVEPEGCFIYNGHIMLSCDGKPIYTLYFK